MQDKTFELLEKMYIELTSKIDGLTGEFVEFKQDTKEEFKVIKNQLTKIEVEHGNKLEAIFDGYKQNTENLNRLEDKIDNLQLDINNLSVKTTHNDSRIIQLSQDIKKAK